MNQAWPIRVGAPDGGFRRLVISIATLGAGLDESDRLRRVGRSGSPAGELLEADELPKAGGLVDDESVEPEPLLESLFLKCGPDARYPHRLLPGACFCLASASLPA